MVSTATMSFHVALYKEPLTALNELARAEHRRERAWIKQQRQERLDPGLSRRHTAQIRREIRAEQAAKRASGEFGGTRDDLITRAVHEEMRVRSMDRDWPQPPDGEVDAPGRRWGTPPSRPMGAGGYGARLSVKLPHELGEQLRRAAYWTSNQAVEALQQWADQWGDGIDVALRESDRNGVPAELALLAAHGRPSAPQTALEIRDQLRARVVTTGDILRAAVDRAIAAGQLTLPAQS